MADVYEAVDDEKLHAVFMNFPEIDNRRETIVCERSFISIAPTNSRTK